MHTSQSWSVCGQQKIGLSLKLENSVFENNSLSCRRYVILIFDRSKPC